MLKVQKDSTSTDHDFLEKNKTTLEFIENITVKAGEIQKQVLTEILSTNANIEYLQRHGLNGQTDPKTFKNLIPVITYEDIKPDINRIANGDTSPVLASNTITTILHSSGTSGGVTKMIPTTNEEISRRNSFFKLLVPIMSQFFPEIQKGKGMYLLFIRSDTITPGGLVARPVLTQYFKNLYLQQNKSYDDLSKFYTSPFETILCEDSYQSMYSQLLCGLCQNKQVFCIGTTFASGIIRVIRFLEKHWSLLCNDIRTGTIDSLITDTSVREAVMRILKPNQELADFIERECSKSSWEGIITKLWPNTKYIDAIITGTMSQYIPTLDYYSNGLQIVSPVYASSECLFAINLNPLCIPSEVSYTFIPTMGYFEFLPVNRRNNEIFDSTEYLSEKEQQELVDLVDVKLGHEYEPVITTYAGLYRYKVGDVLRVAGFKNKAPQFNFVCRKNVILSLDVHKMDEVELHNAMKNGVKHLVPFEANVAEYTSYADNTKFPGHYVLFWELTYNGSTLVPSSVLENCCLTIEESLNSVYHVMRATDKSIGPLEIKIVKQGTFDKLMNYAISLGASINQYKTPRCVKFAPILEILNSNVTSNYFSPKRPMGSRY